MHARLDHSAVKLLTRTGLDWTQKYPAIVGAVAALGAHQAYLDGELCGVGADGITFFSMIPLASEAGNAAGLVFFLFDLLHLDGDDIAARPLDYAARSTAAARHPVWLAAGAEPRALGAARAGRRGQISCVDRGQSAAPGRR
jgi:hypothetical protein